MRSMSLTRYAAVALFASALACARNQETGTAAVQDTTVSDTTVQNPPGYRGMERDTAMVPPQGQQPVDTFIQQQGVNPRADTAGYSGAERQDTAGMPRRDSVRVWQDSVNVGGDTTGVHPDSAGVHPDSAGAYPDSAGAGRP